MDEGLSIGIASQPLFDIPQPPARGRLAAALLHAALRLDGRVRQRAGRHAEPVACSSRCSASRAACGPGWSLFGRRAGLIVRGALRGQPVPHQLRAGDPHVLAHAGPVAAHHRGLPARVRLPPPRLPAGFIIFLALLVYTHNWGLFFGVGALDRAGPLLVRARGPAPLRARRAARLRRAWPCSTCPGCPRSSTSSSTPARPGSTRRASARPIQISKALLGGGTPTVALVLAGGSGIAVILQKQVSGPRAHAR